MGRKNIYKDAQKAGVQFKKGQSGNPKGRPPKLVSHVLNQLKEEGREKVSKSQVREVYEYLIGLDAAKLRLIKNDKNIPMLFKLVAEGILSKKGFDILERLLDRAQGKATQTQEVSGKDGGAIIVQNVIERISGKLPTDDNYEKGNI